MLFDEQGSYKGFREVKEKQRVKNKKDIKNSRLQASKADSLSANTKPRQKCQAIYLKCGWKWVNEVIEKSQRTKIAGFSFSKDLINFEHVAAKTPGN